MPLYRMMVALVAVGLIQGCRTARPHVPFSEQPWSYDGCAGTQLTTEHFDIYSTLYDENLTRALPEFLETAYERYNSLLPQGESPATRLTTYAFGSRDQWDHFVRREFPSRYEVYRRIRSGGFTEGVTAVMFYKSPSATLATLAHEGWHQYVGGLSCSPIPAWLNEGLACYFEAYEFVRGAARFTPLNNTFRVNYLRDALTTDELLGLARIVDIDAGEVLIQNNSRLTQTYYAQVWGLITFLRHGERVRYADAFDQMMADLAAGTMHIRASAARLSSQSPSTMTYGQAVFAAYFGEIESGLADAYHRHLMQLAGFRSPPATNSSE